MIVINAAAVPVTLNYCRVRSRARHAYREGHTWFELRKMERPHYDFAMTDSAIEIVD